METCSGMRFFLSPSLSLVAPVCAACPFALAEHESSMTFLIFSFTYSYFSFCDFSFPFFAYYDYNYE